MIESLPAVNAVLNSTAAVLLIVGWILIKRKKIIAHRNCMIAAFVVSAIFLACYLTYHYTVQHRPFPGHGIWRTIYFSILIPHVLLAVGMLPFIFATFYHAFKGNIIKHKRVAKWTLPIWLYVSITGVLVYVMLYRIDWGVPPAAL